MTTRLGTTRQEVARRGLTRSDLRKRSASGRATHLREVVKQHDIASAASWDMLKTAISRVVTELATSTGRNIEEIGLFIGADGRFTSIDHVGIDVRTGIADQLVTGIPGMDGEAVIWDEEGDATSAGSGLPLDPQSHTISGGAITLDTHSGLGYLVTVDTEGGAALDDLDTISGTKTGQIVVLQTVTSFRDVNLVETGNLRVSAFGSARLNNPQDKITLIDVGATLDAISVQAN